MNTPPIFVHPVDLDSVNPVHLAAVDYAIRRLSQAPQPADLLMSSLSPAVASSMPPLLNSNLVRSLLLQAAPDLIAHATKNLAEALREQVLSLNDKLNAAGISDIEIAKILAPLGGLIASMASGHAPLERR